MALDVVALGASKKYTDNQIKEIESEGIGEATRENIDANTAARHTHDNKSVLNKLGEEGGKLTYNGSEISGSSAGAGENGATFTPSVSEEGVLSWTNDKDLPNPAPVNIKGPKPVKGTDYFTEADKAELVNSVLNSLPTWSGGAY